MRESGFSRPAMAPSRIVEHAPPSGPPIFAADPATAPLPDPVARPAWLWTPYWWDPDELRVTTRRAGVRQAPQQLTRRSRPALAWVFRPTRPRLGRRSGRRVLAATMLAILFALGLYLSASGAEPAPISVSTPSTEGADQPTAAAKCDASTGRLLYVTALDTCVPAEW